MNIFDTLGGTFKASMLKAGERTCEIASVSVESFEEGPKLAISFVGTNLRLVANKTNSTRIAELFGPGSDLWIGKPITLYADRCNFGSKLVDCVRVKAAK